MSGDLIPRSDTRAELAIAAANPTSAIDLEAWADNMRFAAHIAAGIAPTPFVPKSLRVYYRPEDSSRDEIDVPATTATVAAALLTGKEIGMPPMAALRSIDIIEGTPALRAMALRALVLRAGHQMWVVESNSTRAIVSGVRAGTTREQTSTWVIDRAKTAGLLGKPNWQRHPGAMLIARATGEVARWIAPEVLLGLPYSAEELADGDIGDEEPGTEAEPAVTPRRTAQRRTRRAVTPAPTPAAPARSEPVEDEPPLDDEAQQITDAVISGDAAKPVSGSRAPKSDEPDPDPDPEPPAEAMATTGQVRGVERALTRCQITSQHRRIQAVRQIIGRPIENLDELYGAEAAVVIDELLRLEQLRREQEAAAAKVEHQGELIPESSAEDDRWDEYLDTLDADQTGDTP